MDIPIEAQDLNRFGEYLIAVSAYQVYLTSLLGVNSKALRRLNQYLGSPKPGDLVAETSTIHDPDHIRPRVGYLLRTADEPGAGRSQETVHYIKALDGTEVRWTNAAFIRVLTQPKGFIKVSS